MQIGRITRKVLMNWHALSFTTIFTLGLTGAVGLPTSRKTSFQKDKAKQALPFSLPCPPGTKIVPVHAVADVTKIGPKRRRRVTRSHLRSFTLTPLSAKSS